MARSVVAAALIAAVVIGGGMTAPAFAKHGNGNDGGRDGGWNRGSNPPGWSHGNKTGWGGRNMPPGLYKKYHSSSDRGYSSRYRGDYYRSGSYSSRDGHYSYPYSGSSNHYRNYWNHYGY
jgi:hypothetical protein